MSVGDADENSAGGSAGGAAVYDGGRPLPGMAAVITPGGEKAV
jgi:hypothetical protein